MNTQHLEVFAGEDRTPTLYAREFDNVVSNLTAKTVTWNVGRSPRNLDSSWPLLTKTGTVVSAPAGTFSVAITASDTQYMRGDYEHMATTTDADGNVVVVTQGRFRVRNSIGLSN